MTTIFENFWLKSAIGMLFVNPLRVADGTKPTCYVGHTVVDELDMDMLRTKMCCILDYFQSSHFNAVRS